MDNQLLAQIQAQYGSAKVGDMQALRSVFYSKQPYPTAGATKFSFFGDVVGQNGVTEFTTNMERANSFSQRAFLIRAIRTLFFVDSTNIQAATAGGEFNETYLGILHDIANSQSIIRWKIQDKEYLKIAQPLLYTPFGAGITNNALAFSLAAPADSAAAYGVQPSRKDDVFVLDPPQLIEAEVTFNMSIEFNTAIALPAGVTGVIGIWLDGILFRPVQ